MPVYALVVANGGHKLTVSTADAKGLSFTRGSGPGMHREASHDTMETLARQFSHSASRPVVDRRAPRADNWHSFRAVSEAAR